MNTMDFIIIGVILLAVIIAAAVIIKRKRAGKGCSCGCEGCDGCRENDRKG